MANFGPADKVQLKMEALRVAQNILAKQDAPTVDSLLVEAKKIEEYLLTADAPAPTLPPRKN